MQGESGGLSASTAASKTILPETFLDVCVSFNWKLVTSSVQIVLTTISQDGVLSSRVQRRVSAFNGVSVASFSNIVSSDHYPSVDCVS